MPEKRHFDAVLVAALGGTYGYVDHTVGIVMEGHTLPIATKLTATENGDGFSARWQSDLEAEAMFGELCIDYFDAPGLWVVEAEWTDDDVDDEWGHLTWGQVIRRPTPAEMARIADGLPPWETGGWL